MIAPGPTVERAELTIAPAAEGRATLRKGGFKAKLKRFFAPGDAETNGFAIASLICGIVGIFVAGLILGTLAVVFATIALKRIRLYGQRGRGLAIAGLVTGIVGIVLALIILAVALGQ